MRKTMEFKKIDVDLINQWIPIFKPEDYNWVEFDLIKIYVEQESYIGGFEIELYLLGFGIRIYWIYDEKQFRKKFKQWGLSK